MLFSLSHKASVRPFLVQHVCTPYCIPFFNGAAAACAFFGSAREQRRVGRWTGVQAPRNPWPLSGRPCYVPVKRGRVPRDQLFNALHFFSQTELSAPRVPRHIQLIGCDGSQDLILAANQPKFVTGGVGRAGAGGAGVSPIETHHCPSQLEHHGGPDWTQQFRGW